MELFVFVDDNLCLSTFLYFLLYIVCHADGRLFLDALVERDERLCGVNACDALYLAVQEVHQLLVVARIELDEHGVGRYNACYNTF